MYTLPGGEIIDVADDHLELAAALGGETGVHLDGHGVGDLSQFGNGGPTLLLQLLDDGRGFGPLAAAPHALTDHHSRRHCHHGGAADDHDSLLPHDDLMMMMFGFGWELLFRGE